MSLESSLHIRFDDFELDEKGARLTRGGQPLTLPPKAFGVLCALARRAGQLLSKNALLDEVWGHQHVSESVLKTTISELRAALADDAKQPRYIETAARRGYRFIAVILDGHVQPSSPGNRLLETRDSEAASVMIGRRAALAKLHIAWNHAVAGKRQFFWITGEAGIGKTTLIDTFVGQLGPVLCVHGQCVEQYGAGEPYLPVLEALGTLCRNDAALVTLLRRVAPTWFLQFSWLGSEAERETLRRELSGVGQERMLREFGELLEQYTKERPLLLITEDLHWSDHATVHLINHLARRRGPVRFLWVASFRVAEVIASDHPLKALRHELRVQRLCEEVTLEPFSESEVADYVGQRIPGATIPESFIKALHARTEGLPLFLLNIIDELEMQGLLNEGNVDVNATLAPQQIPENLAGLIESQIVRLSSDECRLLETASVCGVEFRPQTVADALGREENWALALCDTLASQQRWLDNPHLSRLADGRLDARYSFHHAFYRHVFYRRIGAYTRLDLHGRIAASLERGRENGIVVTAAEIGTHYEQSQDYLAALRHYAGAAESALKHFAPQEALDLTRHALELIQRCPPGPVRDGLEIVHCTMHGVAAAQLIGVSSIDSKNVFERAQLLLERFPEHPLRAMVLHGLGLVLYVRGEYTEGLALGHRLHQLWQERGDPILLLCACNLIGQITSLQGRDHEAIEWLETGIATAANIGEERLSATFVVDPDVSMSSALAIPLLNTGRVDEALALSDAALAKAERLGPMTRMTSIWFGLLLSIRMDDIERVGCLTAAMRKLVDHAALAQGEGPSEWYRGWLEAQHGAPRQGFERICRALEYNNAIGMIAGSAEVRCYAIDALLLDGDTAEAELQLAEAKATARRMQEGAYETQLLLHEARLQSLRGEKKAALATLQAAIADARNRRIVWLELRALCALCEFQGKRSTHLAELAAVYERFNEGHATLLMRRARALLEN